MKQIYQKIWQLAKPYYEKGRVMDLEHVSWMIKVAEDVCENELVDDTILMPLIILHDIGYSLCPKVNPFNLDLRKAHMEKGAVEAEKILKSINYPQEKIKEIVYGVSVHDNWAFDESDIFNNNLILGIMNDLDFTWSASKKGFVYLCGYLNTNQFGGLKWLEEEKKPITRPFTTKTTKELFEKYLIERKDEIKTKSDSKPL
ncbi:MAG: hypothetical protein ABIH82_04225 [Candidatus Woesearchaeota archaeon]